MLVGLHVLNLGTHFQNVKHNKFSRVGRKVRKFYVQQKVCNTMYVQKAHYFLFQMGLFYINSSSRTSLIQN